MQSRNFWKRTVVDLRPRRDLLVSERKETTPYAWTNKKNGGIPESLPRSGARVQSNDDVTEAEVTCFTLWFHLISQASNLL